MVVKIGIVKSGNIGVSPVLDLLLDERADRPNIDVRVFGSGAKMNPEQVEDVVPKVEQFDPDFCIFISPNPGAPGPAKARELLSAMDKPAVIIGDAPGKSKTEEMDEQGLGYIIVMSDPMIGAKREWLDPTEMAIFNSDILKVLAETGALRLVQNTIDDIINAFDNGDEIELPKLIITAEKAVDVAGFENPYAKAKAIAAYEMAGAVANLDMKGCFMTKGYENFIPLVAAAHEMASCAAKLASEAREIEKSNDTVLRTPHMKEGQTGSKKDLISKPE
ncbi:F420-dependent methylenetetrahydromethanopterin dehydrogenase [Methanobrevibacter millerae]|jgi:methylenetetrahydromethanopterin dehydrogenase|uniref:F420-dependent methylenetetrahydromethanopterin dehydrogenase n=1 Tax=Methanobrevibacter millerae TaxID=230361 RepID=A0A0U3EKN6_9EURY|nr:F420-dependent methylenetetrahydromethanopterin dehydrogenase [Methanobrevibacter millerae]ALT69133.1 F420-dependent methylenetetrahydromethanopterin dehydrogenase Mtd2 [Methanobrevibacter millerae]